jgi:hypothetical protein
VSLSIDLEAIAPLQGLLTMSHSARAAIAMIPCIFDYVALGRCHARNLVPAQAESHAFEPSAGRSEGPHQVIRPGSGRLAGIGAR